MQVRSTLEKLFEAAINAADPAAHVSTYANHILSSHAHYGFSRTVMLAAGKAAPSMASALLDSTGGIVDRGLVITSPGSIEGYDFSTYPGIEAIEAAHPVPDESSLMAAGKALEMLYETQSDDTLVICLLSGGASSLLSAPAKAVLFEEKQSVLGNLLNSGADIFEINTVRKHLSAVKGGRLAEALYPSMVISLIVSDVPGDDISTIASGPTAPDPTTATDALAVLDKYCITPPATVLQQILSEQRGIIDSTPDGDSHVFERAENIVILNNQTALEGALRQAEAFSLNAEILEEQVSGDVAKAAVLMAAKSAERLKSGSLPVCLISGGETTLSVKGTGKGGRNMELALMFAIELEDLSCITVLSAGTYGSDGPTDAAGAIVDTNTVREALASGIDAEACLSNNDSYNFFRKAGGLLVTGPTGTNVMDIQLIFVGA
jgi:glycerate-2-kinase